MTWAAESLETRFDDSTANVFIFSRAVRDSLARLYRPGELYRGCGVIATEISPAAALSQCLDQRLVQQHRVDSIKQDHEDYGRCRSEQ